MSKTNSTEITSRRRITNSPTIVYESPALSDDDIAQASEMRAATYSRDTAANGVLVADGAGLRIGTDRGALIVEDGVGEQRRARRFDKATHGLSRVVVLGGSGSVSIEALHWCRRLGFAVVVLAPDGSVALASTPRFTDDARLRRMQARASDLPIGLEIARELIGRKLMAQADLLLSRLDEMTTATTIAELADATSSASDVDELRQIEASAAALYWQSWAGRPECIPRWVTKDLRRIPPHWSRYEGRRSVLASVTANRKAERPSTRS
jgi:CRISP-associated protein Cas1